MGSVGWLVGWSVGRSLFGLLAVWLLNEWLGWLWMHDFQSFIAVQMLLQAFIWQKVLLLMIWFGLGSLGC